MKILYNPIVDNKYIVILIPMFLNREKNLIM